MELWKYFQCKIIRKYIFTSLEFKYFFQFLFVRKNVRNEKKKEEKRRNCRFTNLIYSLNNFFLLC